jgi:hypothetical protein
MSFAVQAGTVAGVPAAGAGDVTLGAGSSALGASLALGASPALGATPVGVDVTGDVSDVGLAATGVTGDEVPQAETPAEISTPGTASSRTALAPLTVQRVVRRRDTVFFHLFHVRGQLLGHLFG